jgi:hypothetical protein
MSERMPYAGEVEEIVFVPGSPNFLQMGARLVVFMGRQLGSRTRLTGFFRE